MSTGYVVVGVVGAAIAASMYIIMGPERLLRQRGRCAGIANLGNTCFMNAMLQALASAGVVVDWLQTSHRGKLATALERILTSLREDDGGVVLSPVSILQALRAYGWTINAQQQDAYELYHVLLSVLDEERVNCPSLLNDLLLLPADVCECSTSPHSLAYSRAGTVEIHSSAACPLQGLLTSELVCLTCHKSCPVVYEVFHSLSLNLPAGQTECSLQSCLLDFIKSEPVPDVRCAACSEAFGSEVKRMFIKKLSFSRRPHLLCLHLKRTVWLPSGHVHKSSMSVSFPIQLDISFLHHKTRSSHCHYELVAMIEHLGGPTSGHYITYRQLQGEQWVYTSDSSVYTCSRSQVLQRNPYMLFYLQSK